MKIFGAANPFTSASKYIALDARGRALINESARMLVAIRAMVSLLPLSQARKIADAWSSRPTPESTPPTRDEVVLAVGRASNAIPFTSNCLVRALAAQVVLARHGYQSQLKFGVAAPTASFKAHAWLEWDGRILIGDFPDGEYAPLGRSSSG